jgi:DNA polymerase I-like protein with 3'-5' exonuclease and polymerase domains
MKIYNTASLPSHISADETLWLYNGLDSLLTHEIWQKLAPDLGPTYRFERLQLGPVMSLMRRGFAVDTAARDAAINGPGGLIARAYRLGGMTKIDKGGKGTWKVTDESALLQRLAKIVWGKPLNYHSGTQLKAFFYGAGGLRIPEIRESKKGETKVIVNRNALEKITAHYVRGMFIAAIILRLRDIEKQIEVLTKGLSPDDRFIPSYNIGGTDTWRWSSSKHPYRHSSNGQNIDPALRHIFIADPGRVFVAVDLKGAESVVVAYLSGDENYIRAVNSADVHVAVCKLIWPDMGWTGDIAADRALADREFWNGKSYRDISKMCGHASSYMSTPFTIARQGNISMAVAEEFQRKYFRAFPGIRKWQQWVAGQIQQTSQLTNIFGMTRTFWDREWDDATVRKAVAFGPQSAVGTLLNIGQYMIWHRHEPAIQLHAQIHDAVVCSVDEKSVEQGLRSILDCIEMPVDVTDINGVTRTMLIKGDAKVGLNWGDRIEKDDGVIINPNGLKKWKAPTTPTPMPLAA